MSNEKDTSSSAEGIPPNAQYDVEQIKAQVAEVEALKKRASEWANSIDVSVKKAASAEAKIAEMLGKISESQAKADNEALRAYQAKGIVEEHSNAVAKLKGTIESESAAITAKKAELENLAQLFTNLRGRCESDATSIINARATAEQTGTAIKEVSGKASAVQANIEETKRDIDATSQKVREGTKSIEADLATISSAKSTSDNLVAAMQKSIATTNELGERARTSHGEIETVEKESKTKLESLSTATETTLEMQKRIVEYETTLGKIQNAFEDIKGKVEGLLPGATSAGLASSFCSQKNRFRTPQRWWMGAFVACIGLLLAIAVIGGWNYWSGVEQTWDSIWRHLVQRLPFVIPLVWLGVYSGRQYMMSLRMEEEYAFKEAISTAFEGYKREMSTIPENAQGADTPINALCSFVLASLARRPGLIYEGKHHDVTPFTPAVDAAERLIPVAVNAVVSNVKKAIPMVSSN